MKKIFTLLFAVAMFSLVQAQPGNRDYRQPDYRNYPSTDQRDYNYDYDDEYNYDNDIAANRRSYNNNRNGRSNFALEREMKMQVARINRDYGYKMQQVRNSFSMGRNEKNRQLHYLEDQRQRQIRMLYARTDKKHNHHDPNDHPYNRY